MNSKFTETLNEKSVGHNAFQIAVCKDDWMDMESLHAWLAELDAWCNENGYSPRFLKPTNPITIDGKEHENNRLNLSLVEFVPTLTSDMIDKYRRELEDCERH